ncbi:DUF2695 domain-containing protein [Nocardioides donggukensis]|uniref:DUF2695 domain-containing protein n=1 Tax=Nocardioides donggukensis TaxID=2774019 RepID=A0A927K7H5_9ACTN|nr:DUF2695 domain-containing protein [Nocardioides donggukensis]MBD8870590.1 DUF2695 domain-containing protein [Nocardioides donggukensis]
MDGIADEAERIVRVSEDVLTRPADGECLACFVARMLEEFGCDTTLRFARRYRDVMVPRATALERRLGRMGGFCDCEIFLNGLVRVRPSGDPSDLPGLDPSPVSAESGRPGCAGVRRGSARACARWARRDQPIY